jgi:hypothetical protein
MEQDTYEATWEEVVSHAAELAGRRVRVTILGGPPESPTLDRALANLIVAAEQLAKGRPAADERAAEPLWPEAVAEKLREQGFRL